MNWRWIVPVVVALVVVDAVSGVVAYHSATWNLSRTEVLYGWAAVREVCFVFFPMVIGTLAVGCGLLALAVHWVTRPRQGKGSGGEVR